jgi:hypothetical protein
MAYSDFMDVLGRLHKLTPAQRRAVAEVLAEPDEVHRPAEASESAGDKPRRPGRKAYDCDARKIFLGHAKDWGKYGEATKGELIRRLAANYSRSEAAIQRQIDYYRTGK